MTAFDENRARVAQTMSTADLVQYRYDMSLAQMASEVYGLKPNMSEEKLDEVLKQGNSFPDPTHPEDDTARIGNQRFTDSQIIDFKSTYTVVAASSETSAAGDFAVLLERRDGTGFVYAFRSTQPASQQYNEQKIGAYEQDSANNRQMSTYGIGLAQLDGFDRFITATAPLLNGQPAACAGGSLSGQQCLAVTELHPEIFQADSRPNVIINPTGMASFNEGYSVADALAIYRQVLADPNSAANLSNTPNPDTPEGIAFAQAWERAARFKNSPEGETYDSNSVWTTDASGKPVPQVAQSQPDTEFAAMAAQRQTGASFSLNLLFPERSASLNHTLVLESQNQQGYNLSVVSAMGTQPTLRTDVPIPAVPNMVGNPIDAAQSQLFDGHVTNSDSGPSHGFALQLDGSQARAYVQKLIPDLTDEQWGQMLQGATDFHDSVWVGTADPQGSEVQLWTAVFQQLSDQTRITFNCDACATKPGIADAPFDYEERNTKSAGLANFIEDWNAKGQPTFTPVLLTDAFVKPAQEGGVDRTTAAYFDVRNKLESSSPEEREPLLAAIKAGAPIALIPTTPVGSTGAAPPSDTPSTIDPGTDALIQSYTQTLRGRIENWNTGDSATKDKAEYVSPDTANGAQAAQNSSKNPPDADAPAPDDTGERALAASNVRSVPLPGTATSRLAEENATQTSMTSVGVTPDRYTDDTPDPSEPDTNSEPTPPGSNYDNDLLPPEPASPPSGSSSADSADTDHNAPPQSANNDRLTAGAISSATNLILAIEHGDTFAAVVSGVGLANNLSKLNNAGNTELDGASNALGTVASALNLYNSLESGDAGGIIVSSASLLNVVASEAISNAIGMAFGEVVPVLGIVNSLAHGDVVGAAIGAVALAFPVAGAVLMVANLVFGGLFGGNDDIPTRYGDAEARWDATGQVSVSTTRDDAGGGATATSWLNSLLGGLTNELASRTDAQGQPLYGLDPSRLPGIGYAYDPDTDDGYLRLSWTAADGTVQYRQYDTSGSRHDAQTRAGVNDLARDFFEHAAAAIVPAWEAQTLFQQQGSAPSAHTAVFTGEVSADGAHVTRTVLTLGSGSTVTTGLDLDLDGYIEQSAWTTAAVLTVDLDGNGQVSADELVDGRTGTGSRNSLAALDANGDGALDSRDPAFAALTLWIDANGNGVTDEGEVTGVAASISTITFTDGAITVTRSDGTTSTLTRTDLTGDTRGVSHALTQDGLYETQEGGGTTLYAVNQHTFDGDAAHQHGGEANPDAHGEIFIDAGDARIRSLGKATAASSAAQTSIQGDALLHSAGAGTVIAGQTAGGQTGNETDLAVVSDTPTSAPASVPNVAIRLNAGDIRIQSAPSTPAKPRPPIVLQPDLAFVPNATTHPARALKQVTAEMITSATSGPFSANIPLAGITVAALPLVFPSVVSAAEASTNATTQPPATPASLTEALLQDVLAGRRHDDTLPATEATPVAASVGMVMSSPPGKRNIPAPDAPTGEQVALPTQPITVWHSATAESAPSAATPPASQTPGPADRVSTPQAPKTADGGSTTSGPLPEGGTNPTGTVLAPQAQPPAASIFINHAPDVQGEHASSPEDTGLIISPADLLANDSDRDAATVGQTLTLTAVGNTTHGSVTLIGGQIHFSPDSNYFGPASFDYTVSDGAGGESLATFALNVLPVNDAPQAAGESASGREDTGMSFSAAQLLTNEVDADGDPLSIVRVGNGQHGTVSMNGQGGVNFLPDANYSGPAGFDYWVSDGQGSEAQAHVAINLASVNDAPIAENDILGSHAEDMTIMIASADLLRNDRDADSATLTITSVSDALHGTVEQLADSTIRFTPDADYNGPAGFRYTVSDGDGGHTTALAVLTISPVNDAPVAQGETASGDEDHEMIFPAVLLLANDIDADTPYGDQLTITAVSLADPATGSVRIADDGSVHFTPRPDYAGPTVLTYQVSDGAGLNSTARLILTVLPINDAPVVIDETVAGNEDTTLQFSPALLLANDQDIDNTHAELFIRALGPAQHGSVRWQDTATGPGIEFTPDADFSGEAGFVYTVADGAGGESQGRVRVNVASVNDSPIAHDDRDSGLEDTPLTWTWPALTGNDIDVDGDTLSITAVGNARGGTVTMTNSQVSFTPDAEYSGQGGFDYTISDEHGGMSSAHVALEIAAVNDAPTVVGETIQGMEETPLDIDPTALLVNDSDIDSPSGSLRVTAVGGGSHGTVTQLPDGTLRFVPDADFVGTASFNYTVADDAGATTEGTAIIQVANINDAPTVTGETITSAEDVVLNLKDALLANDIDVDTPHGALSISAVANAEHCTVSINSDGSVTFRPEANYSGHAAFDYTVSDAAGGQGTATANLVITPVNDAPLVNNEQATANEDSIIHFSAAALLANDTDMETPGSLHVAGVGAAHGGQVSQSGDDIVFTPDRNFNGAASFSYTVADPDGALGQGRVDISYLPMNDAPVVNGELFHGRQNVAVTITNAALLQNDDDDGGRLNLRVDGAYSAYGGTLSNSQDGVIFQPDTGFSGIGSFNYVVTDGEGASSIGYAQIDFSQANRNPVATDDNFSGDEDVVFNISTTQLLANDSDADDPGALAITGVGGAIHGTVKLDSISGSVIFTPDANYNGEARFNYTVADPYGGSTQATAFLDVKAVNDAPVIDRIEWNAIDARFPDQNVINSESMLYETIPGEHVDDPYRASGRIIAHDPDEDGGTLSYSIFAYPIHGKAWTNQYTQAGYAADLDERGFNYQNGIENISLSQFGAGGTTPISQAWISESASWQYYSTLGDPYTGADPFTIRVSDAQGAYTDVSITTNHLGSSIKTGGGGGCPVVLDLDTDGIELLAPEDSSIFADLNGDGWKDQIGWVAPGDGVLAYDANGDGQIDVMDEISFVKYKAGARTDLEGLAGLDSSGDGFISSADELWSRLGVVSGGAYQDSTGKISAWSSLDSAGITSISLDRQGSPHLDHGNVVFGTSTLTFADGHTSEAGDVMFAGAHMALPDAVLAVLPPGATNGKGVVEEDTSLKASDEIARIRQQALLFNQASATVEIETTAAPIAYIPPQTEAFDACATFADSPIVSTSTEPAPV